MSFFCISRVLSLLNFHIKLHIHTWLLPGRKPRPKHQVPQLQAHIPSLPLLPPQCLNPRLSPMFLHICIFSAMSCPVPYSHLMLAGNQKFLKVSTNPIPELSIKRHRPPETQWVPLLMSLFVNMYHLHHLLHLAL